MDMYQKIKNRMQAYFRTKSIKHQILLSMLLVSVAATVVLGSILFHFSKSTIEKNYQAAHVDNLAVSSRIIDIYLKNIVDLSRTLLNDSEFKKALLSEETDGVYFSANNTRKLERVLRDLADQNAYIRGITAIGPKGQLLFTSKQNYESGKMQPYYRENNILLSHWIPAVQKAAGKELFYGYNILYNDDGQTFSMAKELMNPDTGEFMGYTVFQVKKTLFDKAFARSQEGYATNRCLIIDRNPDTQNTGALGALLYFNGDEEAKADILAHYLVDEAGNYLFNHSKNSVSGWEIANVIEKSELSQESAYIAWATVLVCFGMLLFCMRTATAVSSVITKPLALLEKTIRGVDKGRFRVNEEFDESEIGKIGNQFKNLVNHNLDLRDKLLKSEIREKEAELLLLQSQINPHFLYNTLDALYFMALIEQADDMAEMILALSDTFKLSLNKGDKLIQVKDEIEKVKAYIKIQNMRYHDRFQLHIEVDPTLLPEKMLTFILQPLVENAVYHGLEPKLRGECHIYVRGFTKESAIVFEIEDNGVGMADLSCLNKGYGVQNIRARLQLFYGTEARIKFNSSEGKGTKAVIQLPFYRKEEQKQKIGGMQDDSNRSGGR